ncbi:MAG: hypothetical protein IK093_17345 [Ruminiclostridium sp.]|nr:hypothetical protein [Ruminiclostridium sp.]
MNEQTIKIVEQLKDKLELAESADQIKEIIAKEGGEVSDEIAEKMFARIKEKNAASGTDIDDDEMDAVAGGASNTCTYWSICDRYFLA